MKNYKRVRENALDWRIEKSMFTRRKTDQRVTSIV